MVVIINKTFINQREEQGINLPRDEPQRPKDRRGTTQYDPNVIPGKDQLNKQQSRERRDALPFHTRRVSQPATSAAEEDERAPSTVGSSTSTGWLSFFNSLLEACCLAVSVVIADIDGFPGER